MTALGASLAVGNALAESLPAPARDPYNRVLNPAIMQPVLEGDVETVSLNGDWNFTATADDSTECVSNPGMILHGPSMPVPSNWFLKGAKTYPKDGKGFDYHGTMWFAKTFHFPDKHRGRFVVLEFEGVDYFADVFLNGCYVGSHTGCFEPFKFKIEDWLRHGGENVLLVRVNSPKFPIDMKEDQPKAWPRRQYVVKGVFGYHDCRPGGTGERGQDANTGGIFGGVGLRITGPARFDALRVTPKLSGDFKAAELTIDWEIFNSLDRPIDVSLELSVVPANFKGDAPIVIAETLALEPGKNLRSSRISVPDPKLWWTWDLGFPHLYRIDAVVKAQDAVLDRKQARFGIRDFRRETGWKCLLNGKELFARASNYISTQWLSEMDREKYSRDIRLMREANLNGVRVHAHIEKDDFYDLCDESGILIWQDYPFQWGYTDDADFVEDALRQVREITHRLYNHPSILIWCGHNETPWALDWMEKKDKNQNKDLDRRIEELVRSLDPTRAVQNNSGLDDGHDYSGWYAGEMKNFRNLIGGAYVTEYGAQALPSAEMLERMFKLGGRLPEFPKDESLWRYHNMQPDLMLRPGRLVQGRNLAEWIEGSQRYQAKLIKFGTECYRRAKGNVYGIYQFMFVECWPSITWAVVDYDRKPKLGYEALKIAMQPVLPSIEYDENGGFTLWVVNDLHRSFENATFRWELFNSKGGTADSGAQRLSIAGNRSVKVREIGNLRKHLEAGGGIRVWIEDAEKNILGRNSLEAWEWADPPAALHSSKDFASVTATSEAGQNSPEKAVDGDPNTRWESLHNADPQRITVELKAPKKVGKVKIFWENASARAYDIQVSEDAARWNTVASVHDGASGEQRVVSFKPVQARFVRIIGKTRTTKFGYSIWEIQVE